MPGKPSLNGENSAEVAAIEKRLDDVTGIHIRRYYYSDALFSDPAPCSAIIMKNGPTRKKTPKPPKEWVCLPRLA